MSSANNLPSPLSTAAAVSAISSRLQSGWTLLQQTCPVEKCYTPLVRSKAQPGKSDPITYCCKCQLQVRIVPADFSGANNANPVQNNEKTGGIGRKSPFSSMNDTNRIVNTELPRLAPNPTENTPQSKESASERGSLASLSSAPGFAALQRELIEKNDETMKNRSNQVQKGVDRAQQAPISDEEIEAFENEDYDPHADYSFADDPQEIRGHMERMNNLSSLLGAKMLAGWTLLGVQCPGEDCSCPLVQCRFGEQAGVMECVQCQGRFEENAAGEPVPLKQQNNENNNKSNNTNNNSNSGTRVSQQASSSPASSKPSNNHVSPSKRNNYFSGSQPSSGSMSEDDGWSIVDQRSANKAASPTVLPSSSIAALVQNSNVAAQLSTNNTVSNSMSNDEVMESVSAMLGQKLLQGYTMLAEECKNPNCSCPLVSKKGGPKLCVQCGSEAVDEKEQNAQISQNNINVNKTSVQFQQPPSSTTPRQAKESRFISTIKEEKFDDAHINKKRVREPDTPATNPNEPQATPVLKNRTTGSSATMNMLPSSIPAIINSNNNVGASSLREHAPAISSSISIVVQKLQWTADQLSASHDLQQIQHLTATIQSLAQALKSLQAL